MSEYSKFLVNLNVLKEVAMEYPGKTIENIRGYEESRKKKLSPLPIHWKLKMILPMMNLRTLLKARKICMMIGSIRNFLSSRICPVCLM